MNILLALIAAQALAGDRLAPGWAEFSRRPALDRSETVVEIGTLGYDEKQARLEYWLRRRISKGGSQTISWADSRTCPAVATVLKAMRALPTPNFAPPGFDDHQEVVLDGISYSLRGPATGHHAGAKLSLQTNIGTPLAAWVERSLAALESCWGLEVPGRLAG